MSVCCSGSPIWWAILRREKAGKGKEEEERKRKKRDKTDGNTTHLQEINIWSRPWIHYWYGDYATTSTTWFLFNLVTTHVLHLWSLLLVHLPGPLWKSLIALFSMLHLVYGRNSPLIFASLVRHSLLHFHLSHLVVHHHLLHHLHDHHLHLLLLVQSFTLNLRRGSSANHFLHRPFFSCRTESTASRTI